MNRLIGCVVAGLIAISLTSCSQPQPTGGAVAAQMATCAMCKDNFEYVYSPKGLLLGKKAIKHNCPMCKMEWIAGVSPGSTCSECAKTELACPMCAKTAAK